MQALIDAIAQMPLPTDATRIFHGRGGLYPGCEHWTLDAYPPVFVLTSFKEVPEADITAVRSALAQRWALLSPDQPLNLVFQHRAERAQTTLVCGEVPEPHVVTESGTRYRVHVLKGQNHGLFLDMAKGRQWVRALCQSQPGMRVLNLFAYTCGFSAVALQAGAKSVLNMDMSAGALAIGQQNHQLNSIQSGASFAAHDIFSSWGKISRGGPYDLVIADPPSYQKGSFVATKDYARLVKRLPDLLMHGGHALLCLNAPELDTAFLQAIVEQHAPELQLLRRISNPEVFADVSAERALKVLIYKLPQA
jgi:23S rRNA (cytosine1962-C5)-methyltransferase